MIKLTRKDAEDKAFVKKIMLGDQIEVERIRGFHKSVRRMLDRRLAKQGWQYGLRYSDGAKELVAEIVEKD